MAKPDITKRSPKKWETFSFLLLFAMAKDEVDAKNKAALYQTFDEKLSCRLGLTHKLEKRNSKAA